MAKIVRNTQKIFGINAAQNQITEFGSIKAGAPVYSQNIANIQTAAFEGGWSDALQDDYAPYRQDRNAVDLVTTSQLAYLFQEGVPEWDAGTVYYKGSVVKVTTSAVSIQLYMSKTDDNTANYSDTDNWAKFLDTANAYALDSDVVKLIGNQDISGVKNFSTIPTVSAAIGSTDNSTNVPTTAWVTSRINNIMNNTTPKVFPALSIRTNITASNYTFPSNGWLVCTSVNQNNAIKVNGVEVGYIAWDSGSWSATLNVQIMVAKGDVMTWNSKPGRQCYFAPLK